MALYCKTGTYTGDGTDDRHITGVGFRPKFVMIKGDTSTASTSGGIAYIDSMTADNSFDMESGGSLTSNRIQSVTSDGFTIGSSSTVNESGKSFYYVCIGGLSTNIKTGSYSGTGSTQSITGVGFSPEMVLIKGTNTNVPYWRIAAMGANLSSAFGASSPQLNRIQTLDADGFTLGSGTEVNDAGNTFYYLAIEDAAASNLPGSFTGNGSDSRNITGLSFGPTFVLVKSVRAERGVWRTAAMSGDSSAIFQQDSLLTSNLIQQLNSDGFQVGSDNKVNENTYDIYYYAIKETVPTGIQFDDSSQGNSTGSTTASFSSHYIKGTNRGLLVDVFDVSGDNVTSVTHNSVAMTQVNKVAKGTNYVYTYRLTNPDVGVNTITVTRSSSTGQLYGVATSYFNVSQTGFIETSSTGTSSSSTSVSGTVTTTADNCWGHTVAFCDNGGASAGTNSTQRVLTFPGNALLVCDTNAPKTPPGSLTMTTNCTSGTNALVISAIAPFTSVGGNQSLLLRGM